MNARIVSRGGSSNGTSVLLEDGSKLHGITSISVRAEVDDLVRVDVSLWVQEVDMEGELSVYAAHPSHGGVEKVAKIVFADGQEWTAP